MSGRPISKRYRQFAPKYVANGFNGTQTVIDMGFTDNRKSANVIAHRLLSNVKCRALIEQHIMDSKLTADDVLERLSRFAKVDFNASEIKPEHSIKTLEMLAKHHKLLVDRVESTNTTERDASVTALTAHIESVAASEAVSLDTAAVGLFTRLSATHHPTLSDPRNWGKWQQVIEAHLAAQAVPQVVEPEEVGGNM